MELRKRSVSNQYLFGNQEHSFTVLQRDETIFSLNRAGKPFILALWARSPILVFIDVNLISGDQRNIVPTDFRFAQHLFDRESEDSYYHCNFLCTHMLLIPCLIISFSLLIFATCFDAYA